MAIDRVTANQLAQEIISLLPDDEFRKHWPAAMAAMVLFARNMSAEQAANAAEMGDLVDKNIQALRGFVHNFHQTCAESSAAMRANNVSILRDELAEIILAAKAQFTTELLATTADQLASLNQEIRVHTGIEVRRALEDELQLFRLQKKSTVDASTAAMAKLTAISLSADAAVARLETAVAALSRLDRERQLQKGFFRKLKELFFGEELSPSTDSKKFN